MHQLTDPAQRPPQVILTSGLRVRLLSLPESSHAAALVRIHAGSHDASKAYPGLAHFLEHLLFLGSRNYPATHSLMPFVQRCGGQLNASTRERHTDYFFQLPADRLEEGLRRLLDMLASPLLDPAAQLREREVLQAEYLARAQDAETLCDAALAKAFDQVHPFTDFHAGNRDTLPVEEAQFQQALRDYHQRFYHCGQIELLLAGPQQADELQHLATLADGALAAGPAIARKAPSLRCSRDSWLRLQLDNTQPRLHLAFALEDMPEHCVPALDHLFTWLASEAPAGLAQRLRDEELCLTVKARAPYWYAGQGVVIIELALTERGSKERAVIVDAVLDWLRFFSDEARWQPCRDEYLRIRRRSLQGSEPLTRLRHWVEPLAWSDNSDETAIRHALGVLLGQMIASGPLVMTSDPSECGPVETGGFPLRLAFEPQPRAEPLAWRWQQPAPNPWLRTDTMRRKTIYLDPALRWLGPEATNGQGALFVRWQFIAGQPPVGLWHVLWDALRSRIWAAQQAGVELRFDDLGDSWTLGLSGFAEAIPTILGDISQLLVEPPVASFVQGVQMAERAGTLSGDDMLIRQLIKRLPRLLADVTSEVNEQAALERLAVSRHWQSAQREGLAVGFPSSLGGMLGDAISTLPGAPAPAVPDSPSRSMGYRWHDVSGGSVMAETAFLLFCPLPERDPECEASWRLLGRLIEGDFFRRLRSELQLGYAVFSRFSQFGSYPGMLFAVQSPTASAAQILGYIQVFLEEFAMRLVDQSAEIIECAANELSDQHVAGPADLRARAEQAWQNCLAGHDITRPAQVATAMRALRRADLAAALEALRAAAGGWIVVTNAAAPGACWS
ncbi:pyrroloquinoline quinone biosynthesis protein PqqF [Pseudomonas stutzeri]|uniref:pyrroloquinoline quinone biosynthesis protein PqqF n=1 Tax=Stutzerimonas stutzeri TaxID=316 RepID=UPI00210CBC00|nr:pyrroloquinoline quinone biosynthesis protein PqqF [Stutzerimonas stutzeri]MCQ4310386.1 pyrroloquinoline quinone biosynthesis protein PqqF [Stutzerimonas stutzeri]